MIIEHFGPEKWSNKCETALQSPSHPGDQISILLVLVGESLDTFCLTQLGLKFTQSLDRDLVKCALAELPARWRSRLRLDQGNNTNDPNPLLAQRACFWEWKGRSFNRRVSTNLISLNPTHFKEISAFLGKMTFHVSHNMEYLA